MENTKYTNIEKIIKENSHLTNKELAKKIGKSISWLKAFKAFMNAEDKNKYKDTKNPIYKAIYNIWINDTEAQKKELERDKLKKRIKELKKEIQSCQEYTEELETELRECQKQEKNLKEKLNKLKTQNDLYEKHLEEYKEQIVNKLEEEYSEKFTEIYSSYLRKIREAERRELNAGGREIDYMMKINEFESKKHTLFGILIIETIVIIYLLFKIFTQ